MDIFSDDVGFDLGPLKELIQDFLPFAQERFGFERPPNLFLKSDPENAEDLLGRTAAYNPGQLEIMIYVDKRHPKDILRSIAHELVHHSQNLRGDFDTGLSTDPGYAQSDPHMREMEREAYEQGNLCFRDWEDSRKMMLNESIYYGIINIDEGENNMSKKETLKDWKNNQIYQSLLEKFGIVKEEENTDENVDPAANSSSPNFIETDTVDDKTNEDDDDDDEEDSLNEEIVELIKENNMALNERGMFSRFGDWIYDATNTRDESVEGTVPSHIQPFAKAEMDWTGGLTPGSGAGMQTKHEYEEETDTAADFAKAGTAIAALGGLGLAAPYVAGGAAAGETVGGTGAAVNTGRTAQQVANFQRAKTAADAAAKGSRSARSAIEAGRKAQQAGKAAQGATGLDAAAAEAVAAVEALEAGAAATTAAPAVTTSIWSQPAGVALRQGGQAALQGIKNIPGKINPLNWGTTAGRTALSGKGKALVGLGAVAGHEMYPALEYDTEFGEETWNPVALRDDPGAASALQPRQDSYTDPTTGEQRLHTGGPLTRDMWGGALNPSGEWIHSEHTDPSYLSRAMAQGDISPDVMKRVDAMLTPNEKTGVSEMEDWAKTLGDDPENQEFAKGCAEKWRQARNSGIDASEVGAYVGQDCEDMIDDFTEDQKLGQRAAGSGKRPLEILRPGGEADEDFQRRVETTPAEGAEEGEAYDEYDDENVFMFEDSGYGHVDEDLFYENSPAAWLQEGKKKTTNKEWYSTSLYENLKNKWTKK